MVKPKTKCIICELKPVNGDGLRCHDCGKKIEAGRRESLRASPQKFLTYKGIVVALVKNSRGTLSPILSGRCAGKLPKNKTINLDAYVEGFTREEIKRFKRAVLQTANF